MSPSAMDSLPGDSAFAEPCITPEVDAQPPPKPKKVKGKGTATEIDTPTAKEKPKGRGKAKGKGRGKKKAGADSDSSVEAETDAEPETENEEEKRKKLLESFGIDAMSIEQQAAELLKEVVLGYVEWNTAYIPRLRQVNPRPEVPEHTENIAADLRRRDQRLEAPLLLLARPSEFVEGEVPADRLSKAPKVEKSFDNLKQVENVIAASGQHRIRANNIYVSKLLELAEPTKPSKQGSEAEHMDICNDLVTSGRWTVASGRKLRRCKRVMNLNRSAVLHSRRNSAELLRTLINVYLRVVLMSNPRCILVVPKWPPVLTSGGVYLCHGHDNIDQPSVPTRVDANVLKLRELAEKKRWWPAIVYDLDQLPLDLRNPVVIEALKLLSTNRNVPRYSGTNTEEWLNAKKSLSTLGVKSAGKAMGSRISTLWNWPIAHAAIDVVIAVPEVSAQWLVVKPLQAVVKQIAQGGGWYWIFIALSAKSFDSLTHDLSEEGQRQVLLLLSAGFKASGISGVTFTANERAHFLEKAAVEIESWIEMGGGSSVPVLSEIKNANLGVALRNMITAKAFPPFCKAVNSHLKVVCENLALASSLMERLWLPQSTYTASYLKSVSALQDQDSASRLLALFGGETHFMEVALAIYHPILEYGWCLSHHVAAQWGNITVRDNELDVMTKDIEKLGRLYYPLLRKPPAKEGDQIPDNCILLIESSLRMCQGSRDALAQTVGSSKKGPEIKALQMGRVIQWAIYALPELASIFNHEQPRKLAQALETLEIELSDGLVRVGRESLVSGIIAQPLDASATLPNTLMG